MDEDKIFQRGSTTYYWSSKFFPEATRKDVQKLYSFVRIADNFVDQVPSDASGFKRLEGLWRKLTRGKKINTKPDDISAIAAQNMYDLATKYNFELAWIDAFLASMQMDIEQRTYETLDETLEYIYGSAEVIGLMMLAVLRPDLHTGNSEQLHTIQEYAKLQGRAMQYINFIRDIDEDIDLGRCYFPQSELRKYGLSELSYKCAYTHPAAYREFFDGQLAYYRQWQAEANKGFKYIPYGQRIAVRTAADMYGWTANKLAHDPFVVFDKKVKPSKYRVVARAIVRSLHA